MRLYERALPEMLRFRDSGEIMYEVPLCSTDPFPSKPASADFLTGKSLVSLRTIRQADEKARKKGGERGEEEERKEKERGGEGRAGLTNNSVKTYRGSQPPRISRSISLFSLLPLLFLLSFLINILWMQSVPDVVWREVFRIIVSPFESV